MAGSDVDREGVWTEELIAAGPSGAWPAVASATVVASVLTLLGTVATTVWAVVRWRRESARGRVDEAWQRVLWVVEMRCSGDPVRIAIADEAALAMYEVQRSGQRCDSVATVVLSVIKTGGLDGLRGE